MDDLLFCLLRGSLQLSHRRPKIRPEPAAFQLFYEGNFYFNSFLSEIRVAAAAKSFDTNILHFHAVVLLFRIQDTNDMYRRIFISGFLCVHVNIS